jgi:hypothetical protein
VIRQSFPAAVLVSLLAAAPAFADGTAAPQYFNGRLTVDISGQDVSMQLRLPMTRSTVETASKQNFTQDEVIARLKDAGKMFGFPAGAKCQVESANAFAVDQQGRITKADSNVQAMYRFRCEGAKIDALQIKLFEGLPGLETVKLQVTTEKGEKNFDLVPGKGDVTL